MVGILSVNCVCVGGWVLPGKNWSTVGPNTLHRVPSAPRCRPASQKCSLVPLSAFLLYSRPPPDQARPPCPKNGDGISTATPTVLKRSYRGTGSGCLSYSVLTHKLSDSASHPFLAGQLTIWAAIRVLKRMRCISLLIVFA